MTRRAIMRSNRHAGGLLVMLGTLALGIHVATFLAAPPGSGHTRHTFEIAEGEPLATVASRLEDAGLIRNRAYFIAFGRLTGTERAIKPGEYALSTAMRPLDILDRFRRGDVVLHTLVVPEGYTARQIARVIQDAALSDPLQFIKLVTDVDFIRSLELSVSSLEGYLFPDTYAFPRDVTAEEIIRQMVARFDGVYRPEWDQRATALGFTRHQIVTLASIIEKETASENERPSISGVFHNRLGQGIRLQSDPTVIYGLAKFDGNLRKIDLIRDSPYNTYRRRGLPPGPIANPGQAALEAALYPARVDYLYFVSKNDGTHLFSRSLGEHNKWVNRYQRRGPLRSSPRRAAAPQAMIQTN